jgi:putative transposase
MKVNYQERIEATTTELKIIMAQQRTVTNRQKVQALYLLKSDHGQSITHVAELLGVHKIIVQRSLKQYNDGGLSIIKAAPLDWETQSNSLRSNSRNLDKNQ